MLGSPRRCSAGSVPLCAPAIKDRLVDTAAMARVPEATVRKILSCGKAKPLVALAWHAHVSMRVAFKIQGLVMKLKGPELLPARGGMHFPMTPEEMRWHLNYFNIKA